MKKFYTLLAAATVCAGASAQGLAVNRSLDKTAVFTDKVIVPSQAASLQRATKATVPTFQDMTGEYILSGSLNEDGYVVEASIANQNNTDYTVTVKGFVFSDANDIVADIIATQDLSKYGFSIPGKGVTTLFSEQGVDYKLYFLDTEGEGDDGTKGPTLYADNLEFIYDADNNKFVMNAQGPTYGVAWVNAQGRGNWIIQPEFIVPNGVLTGKEFTSSTDSQDAEYKVYGKTESRFGKTTLTITNLGGMGNPLTLQVADGVATATDVNANDLRIDEAGNKAPFYYNNVYDETFNGYNVTATISNENGNTVVDLGDLTAINKDYGWAMRIDGAKVKFDSNMIAAISNVTADFDENAPVEYFNLQGVRVENPANGLFIKRQGNKVAKVVL